MQGTTLLRSIRWHSRTRSEFFSVNGAVGLQLPATVPTIALRLVCACDSQSDVHGGHVYEVNVGVSQFGALR
jgi:hypothetical protein